ALVRAQAIRARHRRRSALGGYALEAGQLRVQLARRSLPQLEALQPVRLVGAVDRVLGQREPRDDRRAAALGERGADRQAPLTAAGSPLWMPCTSSEASAPVRRWYSRAARSDTGRPPAAAISSPPGGSRSHEASSSADGGSMPARSSSRSTPSSPGSTFASIAASTCAAFRPGPP